MTSVSSFLWTFEEFAKGVAPTRWRSNEVLQMLSSQASLRRELVESRRPLYAINRLPGHLDHLGRYGDSRPMEEALVRGHAIGGQPFMVASQVKAVSYVKLSQVACGGTGISAPLFVESIEIASDIEFQPRVPLLDSYSSGDVIPGAHWALSILERRAEGADPLSPGDGIALINGSFVHVGVALDALRRLDSLWPALLISDANACARLRVNPSTFHSTRVASKIERSWMDFLAGFCSTTTSDGIQSEVSVRVVPQMILALGRAVSFFGNSVLDAAEQPSGNPLFDVSSGQALSQGSFVAIGVQVATSAMMESLLTLATLLCRRIEALCHVLQERCLQSEAGVADEAAVVLLSQVPKLMVAHMNRVRLNCGLHQAVCSGETSKGIEDYWTNGLLAIVQLNEAIDLIWELAAVQCHVAEAVDSGVRDAAFPTPENWALGGLIESFEARVVETRVPTLWGGAGV